MIWTNHTTDRWNYAF